MKKLMLSCFSLMCVLFISACGSTASTQSETTQSVSREASVVPSSQSITDTIKVQEIAMPEVIEPTGDFTVYTSPFVGQLTLIPSEFMQSMGEDVATQWLIEASADKEDTSVLSVASLYSFINAFEIPDEIVREYFVKQRDFLTEFDTLTDEDVDLLLSDDAAGVAERFVNPYGYAQGEMVYSPKWIYEHDVADYIEHDLPLDVMAEKLKAMIESESMVNSAESIEAIANKLEAISQIQELIAENIAFELLAPVTDTTNNT